MLLPDYVIPSSQHQQLLPLNPPRKHLPRLPSRLHGCPSKPTHLPSGTWPTVLPARQYCQWPPPAITGWHSLTNTCPRAQRPLPAEYEHKQLRERWVRASNRDWQREQNSLQEEKCGIEKNQSRVAAATRCCQKSPKILFAHFPSFGLKEYQEKAEEAAPVPTIADPWPNKGNSKRDQDLWRMAPTGFPPWPQAFRRSWRRTPDPVRKPRLAPLGCHRSVRPPLSEYRTWLTAEAPKHMGKRWLVIRRRTWSGALIKIYDPRSWKRKKRLLIRRCIQHRPIEDKDWWKKACYGFLLEARRRYFSCKLERKRGKKVVVWTLGRGTVIYTSLVIVLAVRVLGSRHVQRKMNAKWCLLQGNGVVIVIIMFPRGTVSVTSNSKKREQYVRCAGFKMLGRCVGKLTAVPTCW